MESTRSTKAEEGWTKATSLATLYQAGIFPLLSSFDVWSYYGLVVFCVLCAVCCVRCGVVARLIFYFYFMYHSADGWGKLSFSSPHFHVLV